MIATKKPTDPTDKKALCSWYSDFADAAQEAVWRVAREYGAAQDDTLDFFASTTTLFPDPDKVVVALLDYAEQTIASALNDVYFAQEAGEPTEVMEATLAKIRAAVSSLNEQARHLVQPRLAGSRWGPHRTPAMPQYMARN
jgi:hypothetical protein